MAPVIRPAYTRAQRLALARLAELAGLAGQSPALFGSYGRARELVLEGVPPIAAIDQAIAERERRERLASTRRRTS